jgi:hypothetical protein
LDVGRKGGIGVGDDPSASSFTRCLLNEVDGRQAGPPSLVIGVRAATKPECFYLRAPGSTSIPSIRMLGEPRKPNFWPCLDRLSQLCWLQHYAATAFYKKGCQEESSPSTGRREDFCLEIQPTACARGPSDLLERFVLACLPFPWLSSSGGDDANRVLNLASGLGI